MSVTSTNNDIYYPESDGKPMGETDLHRKWMIRILDILGYRYRGQQVYVASDLLLYYEEGEPTRFVVPDNFLVFDCDPGLRRVYKIWEERKSPDVVFEVTSRSTSRQDLVDKPVIYERIGVKEYFLYDPSGIEMSPPLQGFRLDGGRLRAIKLNGRKLQSELLGIDLHLDGDDLVMTDSRTGIEALTEGQSERLAKEAEQRAREVEQRARAIETAARKAAEARVRELEEEIKRLRG